jgi:hypothetical protein
VQERHLLAGVARHHALGERAGPPVLNLARRDRRDISAGERRQQVAAQRRAMVLIVVGFMRARGRPARPARRGWSPTSGRHRTEAHMDRAVDPAHAPLGQTQTSARPPLGHATPAAAAPVTRMRQPVSQHHEALSRHLKWVIAETAKKRSAYCRDDAK